MQWKIFIEFFLKTKKKQLQVYNKYGNQVQWKNWILVFLWKQKNRIYVKAKKKNKIIKDVIVW